MPFEVDPGSDLVRHSNVQARDGDGQGGGGGGGGREGEE